MGQQLDGVDLAELEAHHAESVAKSKANRWGLSDMHGNVWEWVSDWKGKLNTSNTTDPKGPNVPSSDYARIVRGGGWRFGADFCRSAYRFANRPLGQSYDIGFRPVRN